MLNIVPSELVMIELLGQPLFEIWQEMDEINYELLQYKVHDISCC